MPRGCYEPWGVFRKPLLANMKVSDCLANSRPAGFAAIRKTCRSKDVILSERTPQRERAIAGHPSIKPQSFLRRIVYASLPLGTGIVADPFMGSGSTIAAAEAIGLCGVGVERYQDYYDMARVAIPRLKRLEAPGIGVALRSAHQRVNRGYCGIQRETVQ